MDEISTRSFVCFMKISRKKGRRLRRHTEEASLFHESTEPMYYEQTSYNTNHQPSVTYRFVAIENNGERLSNSKVL
jgi:hypothetical protein